jgi:hypothetical protein
MGTAVASSINLSISVETDPLCDTCQRCSALRGLPRFFATVRETSLRYHSMFSSVAVRSITVPYLQGTLTLHARVKSS